jgi:hypothetical protein
VRPRVLEGGRRGAIGMHVDRGSEDIVVDAVMQVPLSHPALFRYRPRPGARPSSISVGRKLDTSHLWDMYYVNRL